MIETLLFRRLLFGALFALCLVPRGALAENVLAAQSVHTRHVDGGWYDRLHVFPRSLREFSERTLYGYSIREDLGYAVRDHRVMRLKSPFAHLWLSDLAEGAKLSETSNTVLFLFPRDPRPGSFLYRLEEVPGGLLRLAGPSGVSVTFDAVTHRRVSSSGLAVREPARGVARPPDVTPAGLHLRLESVGRSPFLRGTSAMMVDASGHRCMLRTDDLFDSSGAPDSSELRWERDPELFEFLARRCPDLSLPPLGAALVAAQDELARRGRIEAARAAEVPPPTPSVRRATPVVAPPPPTRDVAGHGPEDGGLFEFLSAILGGSTSERPTPERVPPHGGSR